MARKAKIEKDAYGLYVITNGWISRPFFGTMFKEGDEIKSYYFDYFGSVGVTLLSENFRRTGIFEYWSITCIPENHNNYTEKEILENIEWYKNYSEHMSFIYEEHNKNVKDILLKKQVQSIKTPYQFMKELVLKMVFDDYEAFKIKHNNHYELDDKLFSDLTNNEPAALEWTLSEILFKHEFKELGYIVETGWNDDASKYTTIYKIGEIYVREEFTKHLEDHIYDFVNPVEKKIIVRTFEPI